MSHFYLAHPLIRKIKEKKKKRILNIDLAILPSHDTLIPPKQFSVKIEEVEDVEDENVKMHSPSPSPPEAGPSQYTPPQVPTIISQKWGSDLQPGENISPLRYGLRGSTHETRVPHREDNVYGKDCYPTDILRHPEWQWYPGKADPNMAYRMLENTHRYIQAQSDSIPIGEVYYSYSQ